MENTARIAGGFVAWATVVAVVTWLAAASTAREALDFGFGGIPETLGEAWAVFANNARIAVAVAGAALLVPVSPPLLRWVADVLFGGIAVLNATIVGVAVGAYGNRMLAALFPHGPVELLALAFAGSVYLAARRQAVPWNVVALHAGAAVAGLALAALLETYWA